MELQLSGCWVDLFELPDFSGKVHRLFGPATYAQIIAKNDPSGFEVQSIRVGSACRLIAYAFRGGCEIAFHSGCSYPYVSNRLSLTQIDSLRLQFKQTGRGISKEQIYEARPATRSRQTVTDVAGWRQNLS